MANRPERSRDPWAQALLEQNRPWLMAYFLGALGDPAAAEDLVQDVFTAAVENADRFDPSRPIGAWLRGIARNLLADRGRAPRRVLSADPRFLDRLDQAAARAEELHADPGYAESRARALRDCLAELTERARRVLGLKYSEGRLSRDIGAREGMKTPAVDVLLSRSRRALQLCLGGKLGG